MPLEIAWSALARRRLREIHDYVAKDKPEAARRLGTRIVAMTELLRNHPHLGRTGSDPRSRELVIGGTLYVVLYRVHSDRIAIHTIWHGARRETREKGQ